MPRKRAGDCYAASGRLLMLWEMQGELAKARQEGREILLVHAQVFHSKVGWHGHAWLERDDDLPGHVDLCTGRLRRVPVRIRNVYDYANERQTILPKEVYYYYFGQVEDPVYYEPEQARKLMVKTGHFGPWG